MMIYYGMGRGRANARLGSSIGHVLLACLLTFWTCGQVYAAEIDGVTSKPSIDPRDISGVWWTKTYTPRLVPVEGGEIPLTAEGRRRYKENKKAFESRSLENPFKKAGVTTYPELAEIVKTRPALGLKMELPMTEAGMMDSTPKMIVEGPLHRCTAPGVPRIMAAPYPFRIVQTQGQTTFIYEMNRVFRIVRMDVPHANPEVWEPTYTGEAVGRWDGDTLVIDTINFNDMTTIDRSGIPHSDQLHVVEKLRKINGGRQLEALITIEDPVMFTRSWTTRLVYEWRPDVEVQLDWVCDEPHRNLSGVEGIQRAQ